MNLKTDPEKKWLHTYIDMTDKVTDATIYLPWPQDKRTELQQGVPTAAKHIVVHGFYSYQSSNGPMIVAAVQFLVENGDNLIGSEFIPITFTELRTVLLQKFAAKDKLVFVESGLYASMSMPNSS